MQVAQFSLFEIPYPPLTLTEGVRLGQGWHRHGVPVWSSHRQASLLFDAELLPEPEDCFVRLQTYDPGRLVHRRIKVISAGHPDIEVLIPKEGLVSFWMKSPVQQKSVPFGEARLCLETLQSPACLAGTEDERLLGLHIVEFIRFMPGTFPLDFADAAQCRAYLPSGWSEPEPGGIWSNGLSALITLPRQLWSEARGITLEFSVVGRPASAPALSVTAEVAGQVLATWTASTPRPWPIPLRNIWTLGEDLVLLLNFQNPMTPRELGINEDLRSLGIFLKKLDKLI